ncbi:hypothetical protein ACG02S_10390 [Roseateles sp. DC23W]|uniref:Uncharacterized protein n=1 Tax=Pelomonas dachongensis TaxID=3299029 RepID=A0ABW7ENT1_9BURK
MKMSTRFRLRRPTLSLMNQGARQRMTTAAAPVALLWLAVAWALGAP